jgi:hypothetical protein
MILEWPLVSFRGSLFGEIFTERSAMEIPEQLLASVANAAPDGYIFLENASAHMISLFTLCFHK